MFAHFKLIRLRFTMHTHRLLAAVSLMATLWLPSAAFAQMAGMQRQISVNGSAAVRVAPDEVLLTVGVDTRHADLQEATRDNSERMARALALIRRHGVAEKDMQLNHIQVEPDYNHERSRTVPVAYRVHKSVSLRLTQLNQFDTLLTSLYGVGVNQVSDIEYRSSQLRKHRDKARELATQAAREKADQLTAQLGVKRGQALSIHESGGSWGRMFQGNRNQQNAMQQAPSTAQNEDDGGFAAGQISVTATVDVVFAIE